MFFLERLHALANNTNSKGNIWPGVSRLAYPPIFDIALDQLPFHLRLLV